MNTHPTNQGFGNSMNGGSFLCMTYWEIMARAAAGDAEGVWNRLRRFAAGTRLNGDRGFVGNNWVMRDGRIGFGACDAPFCVPEPPLKLGSQTERYTTAPCDWGQLVRMTALRTTVALHDGTTTAQIETSNDKCKTIAVLP